MVAPSITITSLYAGIFGLLYIYLSFRVIIHRRHNKIRIGDNNQTKLRYIIRTHGNFVEYVPFTLLLMAINEYQGTTTHLIQICGFLTLIGRGLHFYGLNFAEQHSHPELIYRKSGMVLTLLSIGLLSLSAIFR